MADPVRRTVEDLIAAGAPSFFERDPSALKALFKAKFEEVSGRTLYPAQAEMFLVEVAAYALSILHEAAQTATIQNTAVFAEGIHLENRGANVSTFRLLAQPAKTTIRFQLSGVRLLDTAIPAGTRVASGTAIIFMTDADLIVPAGMLAGEVTATAETAGAAWNGLSIGAVSDILDPVAYVSSAANITGVSGGSDIEDEGRFRLRVVNALFTIAKTGPRNGYREHVLAVDPEIVDVAVVRPEPGRINIYPLMRTGLPSAAIKVAILAYLDPETRRPMGDDVAVLDPVAVPLELVLTVRLPFAVAGVQEAAETQASKAFARWTQTLGGQVSPTVIEAAVKALDHVTYARVESFGFTDLPPDAFAVLTGVTVNILVTPDV